MGEYEAKQRAGTLTDAERAEFQRAAQPFAESFARKMGEIGQALAGVLTEFSDAMARAVSFASTEIVPNLPAIREAIDALPATLRETVLAIGARGWFLGPSMGLEQLPQMRDLLRDANFDGLDAMLVEHFEGEIGELMREISERHPRRAELIRLALEAHQAGSYALSIPVLLAQADGICRDSIGVEFFMRRGSTAAERHMESFRSDSISVALMSALEQPLPISASETARRRHVESGQGPWTHLNRHAVLHGESVDYGTRVNGCKAISLVAYLSWILRPRGAS